MNSDEPPLEGIAIIGLSGRFPGARNVAEFWANLLAARETISDVAGEASSGDGPYVARRGLLEKPEWFDAAFFAIPPREAEVMDPQQRVFLEESWAALEDAGCDPARYGGTIGVFAGMSNNTYAAQNVAHHPELTESVGWLTAMMGNEKDYLATRTAYKLNLRGPALNIYTACSTSLVAVCQAVQTLLSYGCDTALAGGVSITFPHERGYHYDEGGILSPDGHCRSFDLRAEGTVFSNGVGVVVLKRLADAIAEGDHVYAVIKGAALNNDGSGKVSFTAPSVDGHAEVIALAHALAGVEPRSIGYVEAHGTATPLGDPIEVAGLTQAFRAGTEENGFCALGSVKSNIGHLDAAAGVAGLIKATLAVQHGQIPASLHFIAPNPQLGLEASPFFVAAESCAWPHSGGPRRAGVSSFGVGGTNAHVVLESAPWPAERTLETAPQVLVFSAKCEASLAEQGRFLADYLEAHPEVSLADVAHTLQVGRAEFTHRRALVADSREAAITALRKPGAKSSTGVPAASGVVFMFPGQGSQYPSMGAGLYRYESVFRTVVDECCELLKPELGLDLRGLLFPAEGGDEFARVRLRETRYTQPAIFVVSYALARQWMAWGLAPAACIGHSVGEYVAAALAGIFTLPDALRLVTARARLVEEQPAGAMLAVRLPEAEVARFLGDQVEIAAVNSPRLCVLAGPLDAIAAVEGRLAAESIPAKRLETSHAFHTAMMEPVIAPLVTIAESVPRRVPAIPILSTVTAEWLTPEQATDPHYWARHARQTVRFSPAVARLLAGDHTNFIECGPGTTLTQLTRQQPSSAGLVVPSLREGTEDAHALGSALAELWMHGFKIDWSAVRGGGSARKISLPTYPFQRKRYFADAPTCPLATVPIPAQRGKITDASEPAEQTVPSTPSAEASPDEVPVRGTIQVVEEPRRDRLTREIVAELERLSGLELANLDPALSFIELGFDSLFLTQAAVSLYKRFAVKVTFRQLLQDFPSPTTLAGHLDSILPAEAKIASSPPTANRGAPQNPAEAPPHAAAPKAHGPFRGIDRTTAQPLTEVQHEHLATLIARYTEHTAGSRRYTAEHRPHLADPRAVAGFRREWKDLIYPLICERSEGASLWDVDGHEYLDVTLGFGQILFGHRPKFLVEALENQLHTGIEIGPTSPLAGPLAARLGTFLGLERIAFCNTGSEAVAAALRLARTVTGRERVAVFSGAYHGIFDEVLFRPGPMPIAPGIPASAVQNLVVLEYGSDEALAWLRANAGELAAVMVEPVQSRHPALVPTEFLRELRQLTAASGTALIFDEIVTGFRVAPGGAQEYFGIRADLATYGKIIGGGIPIGIVGGAREYMDALDGGAWQYGDDSFPEIGVTFFAGTFVRHPLALAAASAILTELESAGPALQQDLAAKAAHLAAQMNAHLASRGVPLQWENFSSLYHLPLPAELRHAALLFPHLRLRGIHIWENRPSFLCAAHTAEDIARIALTFCETVDTLVAVGLLPGALPAGASAPAFAPLASAVPEPPSAPRTEFRLTPTDAQVEILLATQLGDEANAAFNDAVRLRIAGPINSTALTQALRALAARHETLRSTFSADRRELIVHASIEPELLFDDLSTLGTEQQTQAIHQSIEQTAVTPFDLQHGPLWRVLLFQRGPADCELVFMAHHAICDGWSFGVIATELAALYSAAKGNHRARLAPPHSFRAHAAAQRAQQASGDFATAENWWVRQLSPPPPPLELPVDHPRQNRRTFEAATRETFIPADLCDKLRKVSASRRCTVFTTLLAGFYTLLHRLSARHDIVVGIASAAQAACEQPLVGHAVNFLPLRLQLDAEEPFADLLPRVNSLVRDGLDRQDVTFGRILQKLALPRDPGRMPLLSVTFNVDRAPGTLSFGGASAEFQPVEKALYHLELSFNLIEHARGYRVFCNFNRDLFAPATIERWLGHYVTLLGGIALEPAQPLHDLPLLTLAEKKQLLTEWNTTACDYPRDTGLDTLFEAVAARQPDAVAVQDGARTLTYATLNAAANMLAHRLIDSGVKPGGLVGLCVERSAELVVATLAAIKAGAAYVPLDPAWPAERLQFMARDSTLATVVTLLTHARHFGGHVILLDGPQPASQPPETEPAVPTAGADLAYIMYTSGSSGMPKGVAVPQRAVARLVLNTNYVQLTPQDVVGHASNPAFDAATFEIWGALLNGGRLSVLPKTTMLDPVKLGAAIRAEGITAMFVTAALFHQLAGSAPGLFEPLRHLIVGGDALNPGIISQTLRDHPPARLLNGYGPTEVTTFACVHHITGVPEGAASIPIGPPIANTQAYILDARQRLQPIGVPGELYLGGDGLARGYHARPELTAERFILHPFSPGERVYRTGDRARWLANGTIEFLGRLDGQVKLRGFRVELGEIESELARHPAIAESAVVTLSVGQDDKALVAYLVPQPGKAIAAEELRGFLRRRLPDYMIPAAFVALERLPLTPNGKLDRRALPAPEREATVRAPAPRNPTQQRVTEIIAATLGQASVELDDDFFRLGGHSLLAMDLLARLRKTFGVEVPAARLFETPTAAGLAEFITAHQQPAVPMAASRFLVPIQRGVAGRPPLFLVAGGWGGEIEFLVYGQIGRHLGEGQPIYGLKARGAGTADAPHTEVSEMAADYLKEIRAIQPSGPYWIAGECVGGICAHEIACQLREEGETVARLILLDTSVPNPDELADYLAKEEVKQVTEEFRPTLGGRLKHHWKKMSALSLGGKCKYLINKSFGRPTEPPKPPAPHPRGQAAYPPTLMRHRLRKYPGRVTLLLDEESQRLYGNLGWDHAAIGTLETHVLPGDHLTYIREEGVHAARKLHDLLSQNAKPS